MGEMDDLEIWAGPKPRFVPPGHFYSPIPNLDEIRLAEARIFGTKMPELGGIELNRQEQARLLGTFATFYAQMPFFDAKTPGLRYYFDNPAFSYADAIILYSMIRHAQPKRVVEAGSGYSSCVILDVNELFFANNIACTFIEPYPDLLLGLLEPGDRQRITLYSSKLQDVDLSVFRALAANDILFIDSTHVSKAGSDVNYVMFEILPILKEGVYIHFHDVFYPFEYPKEWIYEGRAWNEAYLLRAFLQYNRAFEIVFYNTFLEHFEGERFAQHLPLCLRNPGGSLWLRKVAP
jgi:hypothetical protein